MGRKLNKSTSKICYDAVIFARVSSEKQERGTSIEAQIETIYNYCKNKELNIIKEYIITESSMRGDRKQYKEMLSFVKKRQEKTAIVVNCVDCMLRSFIDVPIIDELRKQDKIEIHFLKENLILNQNSKGIDILFWNMCVLMANSYVLSLSDNVKRSMQYNWVQGKWQSKAPIGYLNIKDDQGKSAIIIDRQVAPKIKKMFQEYASGLHSAGSLLKFVTRLGLTRNNKPISRNSIYEILRNPFYCGIMCIKGELIPHIHGAIINKDLFDKVQNILNQKCETKKGAHYTSKKSHCDHAFKGLITCGKCGNIMSSDCKIKNNKQQYTYMRCFHKCGQHSISDKILLKQLETEIFNKIHIPKIKISALKKSINKKLDKMLSEASLINDKLNQQLAELSKQEDNLINFYLAGKLEENIYHKKIADYTNEKQIIKSNLGKQAIINKDTKDTINQLIDIITNLSEIMTNAPSKKQQKLLNLLARDYVLNDRKLTYTIRPPFDSLIECPDARKWKNIIIENLTSFIALEYEIKTLDLS